MANESAVIHSKLDKIEKLLDKQTNDSLLITWLPIVTVIVAGFLAFLQVRKNIVANARVKYIESLRESMSHYLSSYEQALAYFKQSQRHSESGDVEGAAKYHDSLINVVKDLDFHSKKIRLHLDTEKNKSHADLELFLEMSQKQAFAAAFDDLTEYKAVLEETLKASNKVLKESWNQAKGIFF